MASVWKSTKSRGWQPGTERRFEAGNVVTIEPGIYVEGAGGIRIEDDVAIHRRAY